MTLAHKFTILFATTLMSFGSYANANLPRTTTAAKVLPSFSEFWYRNANITQKGACGEPIYKYADKGKQGESAKNVAKDIYKNIPLPHYSDCSWGDVKFLEYKDLPPPVDFPGSEDDWKQVIKDLTTPRGTWFERSCITKAGEHEADYKLYLFPSYSCPKDSRIVCTGSSAKSCSCYKGDQVCLADVLGRKNNIMPWHVIRNLGHVGLIVPADEPGTSDLWPISVYEEKFFWSGIQIDPYYSDKGKTESDFWGAKYNVEGYPPTTKEQAESIIQMAQQQKSMQQHGDLLYTITPFWTPGERRVVWKWDQPQTKPIEVTLTLSPTFRCDTFVYFCYLTGANLKIFQPTLSTSPKKLFNAMVAERNVDHVTPPTISKMLRALTGSPESDIATIFAEKQLDIPEADGAVTQYIGDKSINRLEKINFLWSLASKYSDNQTKFCYLLDSLATLKPVELVDSLISNYKGQQNEIPKAVILVTMRKSIIYDTKEEIEQLSQQQIQDIVLMQNFLKSVLLSEKDTRLLDVAAISYSVTVPPQIAKKAIDKAYSQNSEKSSVGFYSKTKIDIYLNLAFSTNKMQQQMLPALLNEQRSNTNSKSKSFFNTRLINLIANTQPRNIDNETKVLLRHYFLTQKNLSKSSYNWLRAQATLNTSSTAEKEIYIARASQNNQP